MLIKTRVGQVVGGLGDKLKVLAHALDHVHEESMDGWAFCASTVDQAPSLTGTAAREELILVRNNESDRDLIVDSIQIGSGASCPFIVHRSPTGTPGASIAGTPHSLNFGKNRGPDVAINIWDEVAGGMTGLTVVEEIKSILNGVAEHDDSHDGLIIVPPGEGIAVAKGATATEVQVSIVFTLRPSGLFSPNV